MDYTLIPVWSGVITARLLSLHHCRDAAISHRTAPDSPHVSASRAEKVGMIESGSPTTFCLEFGFCSSHSMSRELDDGNWWWHGKVALSPTTLFISVWAAAGSRLSRTEEEKETQMSDQDAGSEKNKNKPSRETKAAYRKPKRGGGGNWDGKTQREMWPRISIAIWWLLRCNRLWTETTEDFFLFKETEFGIRF